jgi:ABC-type antimicrobial peptide transport system permease subunit
MKHIPFFFRQALANMNRNRQRTLFVLFCIAVGVAAIVSLRTLGLMIGDSLTQNLQQDNRGDLAVTVPLEATLGGGTYDPDLIDKGATLFTPPTFSSQGVAEMRGWAEANGYEMSVASRASDTDRIRLNEDNSQPESILAFFVEPETYPFYTEIEFVEPADGTLASTLTGANDIVISERLAELIEAEIGTELRLVGPDVYVVTGIVDDGAEASLRNLDAVLFPYVYLRYDMAVERLNVGADTIYFKLPEAGEAAAAGESFTTAFTGLPITTTEDLRQDNEALSENLTKLITVMGLVSLLIGGIGIANTMNVVVGRRTLEIGVLKTVGLQAGQITLMFLIEAALMGLLGSILGVLLGLGMVSGLQLVAEGVLAQNLTFRLYPEAILMGLVTGLVVTLVFGFLPTIAAGRVRPQVVLNPNEAVLPQAGGIISALVIFLMTGVIGLMVSLIVGNAWVGFGIAYGALIILGVTLLFFWVLVIIMSVLPSFGFVSIRLAQRAIGTHASRTASTLLALVVGMFSLSLILLLTQSVINVIETSFAQAIGGNVLVIPQTLEDSERAQTILAELDGVNSVQQDVVYEAHLVAINGNRDIEDLLAEAREQAIAEAEAESGETVVTEFDTGQGSFDLYGFQLQSFVDPFELQLASNPDLDRTYNMTAGSDINPDDDQQIIIPDSLAVDWLELQPGDELTVAYNDGTEMTLTVAGLWSRPLMAANVSVNFSSAGESPAIISDNALPAGYEPVPSPLIADVDKDKTADVSRAFADERGIFVLEISQLQELTARIINQLTALPLVVAVLALFASTVIIANTVSLATLERRRQIGIMKAIGLQSRDVLRLLLLENGLVGLLGGLIGTGIGAAAILALGIVSADLNSFPLLTLIGLVILAVAISLGATLITAYGAAQEKPLIVLRYE